jgi:hypothetical protein
MSSTTTKKERKIVRVAENISAIESSNATEGTKLGQPSRYKMIPVDQQTHKRLMALCNVYGFGQRGQGAMVRKLVNSEFEKIPSTLPTSNL